MRLMHAVIGAMREWIRLKREMSLSKHLTMSGGINEKTHRDHSWVDACDSRHGFHSLCNHRDYPMNEQREH